MKMKPSNLTIAVLIMTALLCLADTAASKLLTSPFAALVSAVCLLCEGYFARSRLSAEGRRYIREVVSEVLSAPVDKEKPS